MNAQVEARGQVHHSSPDRLGSGAWHIGAAWPPQKHALGGPRGASCPYANPTPGSEGLHCTGLQRAQSSARTTCLPLARMRAPPPGRPGSLGRGGGCQPGRHTDLGPQPVTAAHRGRCLLTHSCLPYTHPNGPGEVGGPRWDAGEPCLRPGPAWRQSPVCRRTTRDASPCFPTTLCPWERRLTTPPGPGGPARAPAPSPSVRAPRPCMFEMSSPQGGRLSRPAMSVLS